MALIGRIALIAAIVAAPWSFGCVTPESQWWLCVAIGVLLLWQLLETLFRRPEEPFHVPTAVLAPVGLLLVVTWQLLPRDEPMVFKMEHAVFSDLAKAFPEDGIATGSVAPATTRTQASLLFFGLAAFFLGARWFSNTASQIWLWRCLALNGAVLGLFGIVQQLTWNGMLFWSVPLRLGGTPFASYVNRNNAAGYLNLCLAAALGWLVIQFAPKDLLTSRRYGQSRAHGLPWRVRVLRRIANVDGRELGVVALIVATAAAVLFSLSRGGIVAMAVGLGACLCWQRAFSRVAGLIAIMLLGAAAVGTLVWVGGWDVVQERIASLSNPAAAAEGRLVHWWDTAGAVLDFPLLGTGFGTYRYANLPYQVHQGDAWYVNADNHLFEMLVETGAIGFSLYVFGFAAMGLAAVALIRSERSELRAAGILGLFAVVSQVIQATTDFGLLIPANAVTFAVICGSVCGSACAAANYERLFTPWWLGLARLEGRWSQAALSLVIVVTSFAFGLELYAATDSMSAQSDFVTIKPTEPLENFGEQFDALIAEGEIALRLRPDDPELHRAIAMWWIDRYRVEAAHELSETVDPADRLRGRQLWQATSLGVLNTRALTLLRENDRAQLERLRQLPLIRDQLTPAKDQLLLALQYGPLTRDVSRNLADLTFLTETDASTDWSAEMAVYLAQDMFLIPSSADRLFVVGTMAEIAGLTSLADLAYRRCLTVSDEHIADVWSMTAETRSIDELLEHVLPDRLEVLVTIGEQTSDEMVKSTLANHAAWLLNEEEWEDAEEPSDLLRARLAELQGNADRAVQHYRLALRNQELEIETRLRLAELLLEEGRLQEARSELALLQGLSRNRRDVQGQLTLLRQKLEALPETGEP